MMIFMEPSGVPGREESTIVQRLLMRFIKFGHSKQILRQKKRHHGDAVVTHPPPTSEIRVQIPAWPYVRKLLVASLWSVVYSTGP